MGNRTVTARNCNELVPLAPLPTEEELALDGGRYFVRPTDGRKLEYYVLGDERKKGARVVAIVNVVCTSATGRLYHKWRQETVLKQLQESTDYSSAGDTILFVNVSTAGVGPSEPYGESLGELDVTQYLDQTSADIIALLHELGVNQVMTMGVSGGWEPSVHLAATLVQREEEPTLKGVCCISGIPWQTKTDNFWELALGSGWKGKLAMMFIESSIAPYMMGYMFPMSIDQLKQSMKADDLSELETALGDMLNLEVEEMNRANAYYLFVSTFLGRLTMNSNQEKLPDAHADLTKLSKVPVHLHFSTKDTMVPTDRVKPWLMNQMPHATAFDNDLPHMVPPVERAIEELLKIK